MTEKLSGNSDGSQLKIKNSEKHSVPNKHGSVIVPGLVLWWLIVAKIAKLTRNRNQLPDKETDAE